MTCFFQCRTWSQKKQLKLVSTTRWNTTEAAVDIVMSRYKELVLDALTKLPGPAYNSRSGTITAAVGLKKRLKDFRIGLVLPMEVLKAIYRIFSGASRWVCWLSYCIDLQFVALDEVNQQMTSRINSDGLTFMRQLSVFMPSSLPISYHFSTDDIQVCVPSMEQTQMKW